MADWLHCNLCFAQPGGGSAFSLTNCGHIYCEKCLVDACQNACKMCGSKCTTVRLSASMKPEVEVFFTDPFDILRKSLKQTSQVLDFQRNHRRRMLSFFKEKVSKQEEVLNKAHHSISQYQHLEREIIKLREENSYLKRLISEKGIGNHSRMSSFGNRPVSSSSPGSYRASPNRSPGPNSSPYQSVGYQTGSRFVRSESGRSLSQPAMTTSPLTTGRISIRTPPSGGKIASNRWTPVQDTQTSTPLSVPHPISLPSPSPRQ